MAKYIIPEQYLWQAISRSKLYKRGTKWLLQYDDDQPLDLGKCSEETALKYLQEDYEERTR